jgi:hypothetical protein
MNTIKNRLPVDALGRFKQWLISMNVPSRAGKGEWQVLQVCIPGVGWQAIHKTKNELFLTVTPATLLYVDRFLRELHPTTYNSEEAKYLPSGMYLGLFHGRSDLSEDMDDWGFNGPVIGPLQSYHVTYHDNIRVRFYSERECSQFFPAEEYFTDEWADLEITEDCLEYQGKFYGDWVVYQHNQLMEPIGKPLSSFLNIPIPAGESK